MTEDVSTEERLDTDELISDFGEFMNSQVRDSRWNKLFKNMFHMWATVATNGAYLFIYLGYYVYKFLDNYPVDDYSYEVKVEEVGGEENYE